MTDTLASIGCSFVWGDELIGFDDNPPTHFNNTFGQILSNQLGYEHVNLACCGNGNDKIFRDALSYLNDIKQQTPKVMVVVWSAFRRIELFEVKAPHQEEKMKIYREQSMSQFSPVREHYLNKENKELAAMWCTLINNNETGIIHTLTYMNAMQTLCDGLGIKLLQSVFHPAMSNQLLNIFYENGVKDKFCNDYNRFIYGQIKTLRPECRGGIGFVKLIDKIFKDPTLTRKDVKTPDGCTKDHTGKNILDDSGFVTMYELGKNLDDIAEYGHPKEKTHEVFANNLYKILEIIEKRT